MDDLEIRLRCIEAAARIPWSHKDGPAAAVQEAASSWFDWITRQPEQYQEHTPESRHDQPPKEDKSFLKKLW